MKDLIEKIERIYEKVTALNIQTNYSIKNIEAIFLRKLEFLQNTTETLNRSIRGKDEIMCSFKKNT